MRFLIIKFDADFPHSKISKVNGDARDVSTKRNGETKRLEYLEIWVKLTAQQSEFASFPGGENNHFLCKNDETYEVFKKCHRVYKKGGVLYTQHHPRYRNAGRSFAQSKHLTYKISH